MIENKFYKIVNTLINDSTLNKYDPLPRADYVLLMLPVEGFRDLMFRSDRTYRVSEQHMTVFEYLEQEGDRSLFHYTAKLNSSDGLYVYRLRVFFNDNDQPMGVSWYRKALNESDESYDKVELTVREIKRTMDFAVEQINSLLYLIRDQQTMRVDKEIQEYKDLDDAYDQLIDNQVEGVPFAIDQALTYLAKMKQCLHRQEALCIYPPRSKWLHIERLEALSQMTHQPVIEKKVIEIPSSFIVDSNLEKSVDISPGQTIKRLNVSKPEVQTTEIEEIEKTFSNISSKQALIPEALKTIPTTTKKTLNEAYLMFIDDLQNDYRACCEQYLVIMESHSSISELKYLKKIKLKMDLIAKEQERIEAKYVQTLLLFGDQTMDIMTRLRACEPAIRSLMINSIKLVIRSNKSHFLQLILDYKKFTTVELVDIMKVILTTDGATECLSDVLKRYRIHLFLLQKDSTNVLLATYVFRLPKAHSMRLECVYDISALSSSTFYQKMHVELQKSKRDALYDAKAVELDIENARMAESLYASSFEQKQQVRQNIEWIRQLPASVRAALGRISFEPDSPCERKVAVIYRIFGEINVTMRLLSLTNPAFVNRLKQESNSLMRQFNVEICENEAHFVEFLNMVDAARLEKDLDEMIEYSHLLNNYLRYCSPISSTDVLSEAARIELRERYFVELKRFGMKENPYEALRSAVSAVVDGMRALQSLLGAQVNQLERMRAHPNNITATDMQTLVSGFEAISMICGAENDDQQVPTNLALEEGAEENEPTNLSNVMP